LTGIVLGGVMCHIYEYLSVKTDGSPVLDPIKYVDTLFFTYSMKGPLSEFNRNCGGSNANPTTFSFGIDNNGIAVFMRTACVKGSATLLTKLAHHELKLL
jgi:hypothetical protein